MFGIVITPELILILLFVLGFGMFVGALSAEHIKRCLRK